MYKEPIEPKDLVTQETKKARFFQDRGFLLSDFLTRLDELMAKAKENDAVPPEETEKMGNLQKEIVAMLQDVQKQNEE